MLFLPIVITVFFSIDLAIQLKTNLSIKPIVTRKTLLTNERKETLLFDASVHFSNIKIPFL